MTAAAPRRRLSTRVFVVAALVVSFLVAGVLRVFASSAPDGLMSVAAATGFADTARAHPLVAGPFAGYAIGALGPDAGPFGPLLVGGIGVGAVFGLVFLALRIIARAAARPSSDS